MIIRIFFFMALTWMSMPFLSAQNLPRQFSFGPFMSLKSGANGGAFQDGRKSSLTFNGIPDFGFTLYMPTSQTGPLGVSFDLGYSSYSYNIQNTETLNPNNGTTYTSKFSYLALSPYFHISYFQLGFCFGVPISGSSINDIKPKDMNPLAEFRIRGEYTVISDAEASMNVFLVAGYMLTGVFKDYGYNDPLKDAIPAVPNDNTTNRYNPRVVSVSLGVNYLFNMLSGNPVAE